MYVHCLALSQRVPLFYRKYRRIQGSTDIAEFTDFVSVNKIPDIKWDKVFKNGPNKIFGREPLKNLKWYGVTMSLQIFKGCLHKFYLAHS